MRNTSNKTINPISTMIGILYRNAISYKQWWEPPFMNDGLEMHLQIHRAIHYDVNAIYYEKR